MSGAPTLSIVIPAFDEAETLGESLPRIHKTAGALGIPFEIIVVDDGSSDGTDRALIELAIRLPELRAISFSRNFGKEAAIHAGLDAAEGAAVVMMDSDLQHPPELLAEMVRRWREDGVKVVNAVKSERGRESVAGSLGARMFYRLYERLSGTKLAGASDFKLLDREVVEIYRRLPERHLFFRGIVPWLGFREADVSFEVPERHLGRSKWPLAKRLYLALDALSSFSAAPLQFVTMAGLAFLFFAVLLGGQTVYTKLSGGAVEGFATVILLVLITGAILMLSLGIIGQYLAKIYDEIKRRPRYVIREELRSAQRAEGSAPRAESRYMSNPPRRSISR